MLPWCRANRKQTRAWVSPLPSSPRRVREESPRSLLSPLEPRLPSFMKEVAEEMKPAAASHHWSLTDCLTSTAVRQKPLVSFGDRNPTEKLLHTLTAKLLYLSPTPPRRARRSITPSRVWMRRRLLKKSHHDQFFELFRVCHKWENCIPGRTRKKTVMDHEPSILDR